MPKKARDVIAGLEKKGFAKSQGDHAFFELFVAGKKTAIYTKVSHGASEIDDRLLGMMARQVKLNRKQFNDLVDCPLTLDQYTKLLRDGGHVAKEEPPAARR